MKICNIEKEQFESFARTHKYRNYYQSLSYAKIMKSMNNEITYIGILDDENRLIGASLLLLEEAFMKNKIAYAPRGILFDFTDARKVEELVTALKRDLGKQNIISLTIDPAIPITIRDSKGNIVNINNEAKMIMSNLTQAGFSYKGQNIYFENKKPRWESLVVLQGDLKDIYKKFEKRCRNKINKALKAGVEIYRDDQKDLTKLYNFIKNKEKKPFKYYKNLCDSFGKQADIFYAVLNTERFVLNSKKLYEDELAKNEIIADQFQNLAQQQDDRREIFNKKLESDKLLTLYKNNLVFATNILKEHPEGLVIAGCLNIVYDNAAFMVIEGIDNKYKNLNASYLLKWRMINDYNNEKLKYYNLNGISGNFNKTSKYAGLNEMKLGFNSVVTEYIGEYNLIINNMKNNIYKNIKKK